MASVTADDVAEAKRAMRDEHIDDSGRSQYATIFVPVVTVYFGVETFERQKDKEGGPVEHAWGNGTVDIAMVRDSWDGKWKVKEETSNSAGTFGSFPFEAKKYAEARLIERMLHHEEDITLREMVEETAGEADLAEQYGDDIDRVMRDMQRDIEANEELYEALAVDADAVDENE